MSFVLDTTVLGQLCHPRKHADVKLWFRGFAGVRRETVYLPEVADFELRRKLLHLRATASLRTLDGLPSEITYLPITTAVMRDAAALWARLWDTGQPVGVPDALGADVILAAQARAVSSTVITDNPRHLGRMVPAVRWPEA